jgi:hypothetical protein
MGASEEGLTAAVGAERDDTELVAEAIGRVPECDFDVVVRRADGAPVVIRNDPFFRDGTPMPTRYWLVDRELVRAVSRLETVGGVRQAEHEVDPAELHEAHRRYAAERDAAIPPAHTGPRPFGGVGGTRQGVKCLHAHYAWLLAGGDDPVGSWVAARLDDLQQATQTNGAGEPTLEHLTAKPAAEHPAVEELA